MNIVNEMGHLACIIRARLAKFARKAGWAREGNVECEMMNVELSKLEQAATEEGKTEVFETSNLDLHPSGRACRARLATLVHDPRAIAGDRRLQQKRMNNAG